MADIDFSVLWGTVKKRLVDMLDGTHAERVIAQPPANLLTGTTNPRLRVDVGQTSFFEGHEFRTFREFSQPLGTHIPTNQRMLIRIVAPINFILMDFEVTADNGQVRITSFAGGTSVGTFSQTLPRIPANAMIGTPAYTTQLVLTNTPAGLLAAVNITGGVLFDVLRLKVENSTGSASSVGAALDSTRGVAPATYYYLIENIGAGDFEGVLSARWEERP